MTDESKPESGTTSAINSLQEHIIDIKVALTTHAETLKHQALILDEHVKRTAIAEKRLDKLEIPYKMIAWIGAPSSALLLVFKLLEFLIKG